MDHRRPDWDAIPLPLVVVDETGAAVGCNAAAVSQWGPPSQPDATQPDAKLPDAKLGDASSPAASWSWLLATPSEVERLVARLAGAESFGVLEVTSPSRQLRLYIGAKQQGRRVVAVVDRTTDAEARDGLRGQCHFLKQQLQLLRLEREMVAYELHDGAVQTMTAAAMYLQTAASQCDGERAQQSLRQGMELLTRSIQETRHAMRGLEPPLLADAGLADALQALVEAPDYLNLRVTLSCDELGELPAAASLAIYRIVQQALVNIVQHSGAESADVRLAWSDSTTLEIVIADTGQGIDPQQKATASQFGLRGIQRRAELLGGTAVFEPNQPRGTRLIVRLPVAPTTGAAL